SWETQGDVSLQWFRFDSNNKREKSELTAGLFSQVELFQKKEKSEYRFKLIIEFNNDDKNRNRAEMQEAYLSWSWGQKDWKILFGNKIFNWAVLEVFRPTDSINSRYYGLLHENSDKLGEMTFELERRFSDSSLSFYFFPFFIPPRFPSQESRMGLGVDLDDNAVITSRGESKDFWWVLQGGLRAEGSWRGLDWGVHFIHHIDRRFPIVGTSELSGNIPQNIEALRRGEVSVYYFKVNEYGFGAVTELGAGLLKIEGVHRDFDDGRKRIFSIRELDLRTPQDHTEVALGVERTFDLGLPFETTLMVEFNRIFDVNKKNRKEMAVFQQDLFIGTKHSFNDIRGREVLLGFIVDLEGENETFYSLEYTYRPYDDFKIDAGLRVYDAPSTENSQLYGFKKFDRNNHAFLNLILFF
ncbi:MAG: hypothetical protein OXB84_04250, partial [Halobacteriovoraceae bacterium]|nr:hypothetical protein [Halobacteriovoraceae bacterium]